MELTITRRDTTRKSLLLNNSRIYQQQQLLSPIRKKGFLHKFKYIQNNIKTKTYASEEERLWSKIQDPSFFLSFQNVKKNWFQQLWEKFSNKYPPYEPENPFLLIWYLLILFVLWFNIFQIPLVVFFGPAIFYSQFHSHWIIGVNAISIVILSLDILLKINLSYYNHGIIVMNRLKIIKQYLKMQFWIDSISILVLIIYVAGDNYNLIYLKFLFYLKCYSIWKYDNQIQKIIQFNTGILAIYRLLRVVIIFLVYCHWLACGFFAIDYYLYNNNTLYQQNNLLWLSGSPAVNGMDMLQIFPQQWSIWYAYSLYWALQTATTVGYGDITPKNPPEILYVNINMIGMCIMFGYFINSVWQILGDYNERSYKYKKNMSILNRFLINKNISNLLKQKVRAYLDYLWRQDTIQQVQQLIINKLTTNLKDQLTISTKYPFFLKLRLFSLIDILHGQNNNSYQIIKKQLAYSLSEQYFSQDQFIFEYNQKDTNLYYLLDGRIKLQLKDFQYRGYISISENFGQYEFVTDQVRQISAIAVKYTYVYSLARNKFLQILKKYPLYYENYLKLQYKIRIQRKLEYLNIQCFKCFEYHLILDCPQVHVQVKYSPVNKLYSKKEQFREKYRRADIRKQIFHLNKKYNKGMDGFQKAQEFEVYQKDGNLKQIMRNIKFSNDI